jgi:hypothetical protein
MIELYSPRNEVELALIRSILDSERINHFVRNDNFGSMEVGPRIELFNKKMILIQDEQYERAKELLADYLSRTEDKTEVSEVRYSLLDKIRMAIEVLLFGWLMPGRKKRKGD